MSKTKKMEIKIVRVKPSDDYPKQVSFRVFADGELVNVIRVENDIADAFGLHVGLVSANDFLERNKLRAEIRAENMARLGKEYPQNIIF